MRRKALAVAALLLLLPLAADAAGLFKALLDMRLPLPESLKGPETEIVAIKRSNHMPAKKPMTIGDAQVVDFRQKWTKSDASGWSAGVGRNEFGVRRKNTTQRFTFTITTGETQWKCACAIVVQKEGNLVGAGSLGTIASERAIDDTVECDLLDQTNNRPWTLSLDTSIRPHIVTADITSSGTLSDGEHEIDVAASHEIEGTKLPSDMPSGYFFGIDDTWKAAIETSMKGSFRIRSDVTPRDRDAITAASAALALRARLGGMDLFE